MSGVKRGVENDIFFWSEVGSGFGEQGSTCQPRIPKSTPWASSSKSSVIPNLKVESGGWGGGGGGGPKG